MLQNSPTPVFNPEIPPDLEHAPQIRSEAFDWLDAHYPGILSFTSGRVLRMVGEEGRRWLIARLRAKGIGDEEEFSIPATADALTVLFLRSRGVRFSKAVDALAGGQEGPSSPQPRYGGVWNRLVIAALERLRRRVPPRLLGSAVSALLRDPKDHPNCLVIVKRHGKQSDEGTPDRARVVGHDYVYRTILERPAPSCSVIAPSLEVLFFQQGQLPSRSEVTARHFIGLRVATERDSYEVLLGTMSPVSLSLDGEILDFVGRILDIVFLHFEQFHRTQSSTRFETATEPEHGSADDLQLWLMSQLLDTIYPGSLCEITEMSESSNVGSVLASSVAKPWEPSPWDPPKSLEMLSGYVSRTGVPLVVHRVEHPWTTVIESVESEVRYLKSRAGDSNLPEDVSALALPIISSAGSSIGSLYMLVPRLDRLHLDVEVRVLAVFSRIVGEIIERQRAAVHSARVSASIATSTILDQDRFNAALLDLLGEKAAGLAESAQFERDVRLPFLLLSAHRPEPDESDPADSERLRTWLVETLRHLEWRSFVRSHWSGAPDGDGDESFIGELPSVGMMIALGKLVSKDELDRIRNAFPSTINRISPSNSPVKLLAWVLDVPAQRILDAAERKALPELAQEIEHWAFNVATVVDDVAQSSFLAHEQGEWDAALRRVRKALQKEGARKNSYLRRIAADCSFSLGDWPSALKYAHEAAVLSRQELGSGLVRSLCQEGDAHLCLCEPVRAWDLYTEAASGAPIHPLPRYYRGQSLLLMGRLLQVYDDERRREGKPGARDTKQIETKLNVLVDGAMEDLTAAADLLDRWGLIPESYQYRNFHLVPTLLGQGAAYLLTRSPGPAASRLQSARRAFPKDDLFFREFLFAKCWEQGLHRRYGELFLSDGWNPLRDRLQETFSEF